MFIYHNYIKAQRFNLCVFIQSCIPEDGQRGPKHVVNTDLDVLIVYLIVYFLGSSYLIIIKKGRNTLSVIRNINDLLLQTLLYYRVKQLSLVY